MPTRDQIKSLATLMRPGATVTLTEHEGREALRIEEATGRIRWCDPDTGIQFAETVA